MAANQAEVAPRSCYVCVYGASNTDVMPMCDWCKYLLHKEAFGKRFGTEMMAAPAPAQEPLTGPEPLTELVIEWP